MKTKEKQAKIAHSKYVRLRDCLATTGTTTWGNCFTCNKLVRFEEGQCGHFVGGRTNAVFFEEHNSFLQCKHCNETLGGNPEVYREKMIKRYGIEEVERLEALRFKPVKFFDADYEEYERKFSEAFSLLTNRC